MSRFSPFVPVLFAVTLFVSATLLFLVQPMVAKMVLPKFGGTPAVWNTCMVLFQALLLAGYAYAHAATARLGARRQAGWHCLLLLVPLAALPIAVPRDPPGDGSPVLWLLWLLLLAAGLPFLVVSASAPLLQRWFAGTGHPAARDPYFLYAASNLGSMLALLGYPALVEPSLRLRQQSWLWAAGYGLLALLTAACALALRRAGADRLDKAQEVLAAEGAGEGVAAPSAWRRLYWVALSFVPSSLMLGVTTYLSTDIAAIPLIWVVPLALYLLSFILVFSRLPPSVHRALVRVMPMLVVVQIILAASGASLDVVPALGLHLTTLFVVAMVCHGELARTRPAARHLTEFYLWMSVGGVLGGMFNALLAPLAFVTVAEYPLALVAACLLMPNLAAGGPAARRSLDFVLPALLGGLSVGLGFLLGGGADGEAAGWLRDLLAGRPGLSPDRVRKIVQFGIPALLCYALLPRPVRFGLGVGAVLAASALHAALQDRHVLLRDRSFFGVLRVENAVVDGSRFRRLVHGTTVHGMECLDDPDRPRLAAFLAPLAGGTGLDVVAAAAVGRPVWADGRPRPLTYYTRSGPIGQVFTAFSGDRAKEQVALIGLGTGSLAYYGQAGQHLTFYEIDPAVIRIAEDPRYFTFLSTCRAGYHTVPGDARLSLRDAAPGHFGLIVVDAFSSDAIPVHLITREALRLYLDRLAPDGVLAFHISNRYLDLEPVLGRLAEDAGLAALVRHDDVLAEAGKFASSWVILARRGADFGPLAEDHGWRPPSVAGAGPVWTDDFSNILSVFRLRD